MDPYDFEFLQGGEPGGEGGFTAERACGIRMSVLRAHTHFFDFLNGKLRFRHKYLQVDPALLGWFVDIF